MATAFERIVEKLIARAFYTDETLPDPLPAAPWRTFRDWWDRAHGAGENDRRPIQPNPNAMTLATVDEDGMPSCRVVLCRGIYEEPGCLVFYTNYTGRKGRAMLGAGPGGGKACANFHWDPLDLQARFEGFVVKSPAEESDEYFAQRGLENRLGAWASDQSQPIGSRGELLMKIVERIHEFDIDPTALIAKEGDPARERGTVPRPPHWGGFRLFPRRIELWCGSKSRVHDRAEWQRDVDVQADGGVVCGPWSATRVQP